jgi:hypothetical protein
MMKASAINPTHIESKGSGIQRDTEGFTSSGISLNRPHKRGATSAGNNATIVRVEIDTAILLQLLKGRRLCAADMRCLDCESKSCLLRLLLKACAQEVEHTRSSE